MYHNELCLPVPKINRLVIKTETTRFVVNPQSFKIPWVTVVHERIYAVVWAKWSLLSCDPGASYRGRKPLGYMSQVKVPEHSFHQLHDKLRQ